MKYLKFWTSWQTFSSLFPSQNLVPPVYCPGCFKPKESYADLLFLITNPWFLYYMSHRSEAFSSYVNSIFDFDELKISYYMVFYKGYANLHSHPQCTEHPIFLNLSLPTPFLRVLICIVFILKVVKPSLIMVVICVYLIINTVTYFLDSCSLSFLRNAY